MLVKHLAPALAVIGSAAAQCSKATTTINSNAEATALGTACSKYKGSIVIGTQTENIFDFPGVEEITGDLTLLNNPGITTFSIKELTTVGGTVTLQNLTLLTSFTATVLTTVDQIHLQSLPALGSLTIGPPGITKANEVIVSDTFLEGLAGIDVRDVKVMDINNNRRLKDFTTALRTVSDSLKISANNKMMAVTMNSLQWIKNMEIANVTTFEATALNVVNGSARFDSNYFDSFIAPNLTKTQDGDISFVGNSELSNITLTSLSVIGGGLLIANNTALKEVTGFPKLKTVGGALKMKGNFTGIQFPALNDVKGAFDISSTTDIKDDCDTFQKLSSKSGGGQIQGTFNCESDNANANSDTGSGSSGGKGGGGAKDDAATGLILNTALFAVSAFAGISMLL